MFRRVVASELRLTFRARVLLVQDDELKLLVHRLAKSFEAQALTRRSTGFIRLTGGQ